MCHSISMESIFLKYHRVPTAVHFLDQYSNPLQSDAFWDLLRSRRYITLRHHPRLQNVPNVDSSCFDSWDKTIWEFRAKTSGQFSRVWESFHKISSESEIDRGKGEEEISPEKSTKTVRILCISMWKCVCIRRKRAAGRGGGYKCWFTVSCVSSQIVQN